MILVLAITLILITSLIFYLYNNKNKYQTPEYLNNLKTISMAHCFNQYLITQLMRFGLVSDFERAFDNTRTFNKLSHLHFRAFIRDIEKRQTINDQLKQNINEESTKVRKGKR